MQVSKSIKVECSLEGRIYEVLNTAWHMWETMA